MEALMRRSLILGMAFVTGVGVRAASGQSAAPPVELGLDVSATFPGHDSELHRGPRLVVNLDGRQSVQFTASLQKLSPRKDFAQETDLYLVAYRRRVHTAGPVAMFATLGGGLERTAIVTNPTTFGDPPVTSPGSRGVDVVPAFTSGAAIDVRLGRRAAIVLESSFVLTDTLGGRVSGGLVVPVGSYPSRPGLASSLPWAKLGSGDRAWVTTGDGRDVDGEVVGQSATTLTLRTRTGVMSFAADEVRAIDTTDPIRNGTVLGAKIGGFGALLPSVLTSLLYCALDDDGCSAGEVLWINGLFVGIGTGVGAAIGALTDSLRERRVQLYRRGSSSSMTLAPIVGGHQLGGRAVIRW
jgi:hypothetical protein